MPDASIHSTLPVAWAALLEALPAGVVMADVHGQYLQANAAALELLGLDRGTLLSGNLHESRLNLLTLEGSVLAPEDFPGMTALRTGRSVPGQVMGLVQADGDTRWLEVASQSLAPGGVLVTLTDITQHHLTEAILAARTRIAELAATATLEEILRTTLDEAERLTGSTIGFYHFMEPDQRSLTLQAWSTRTEATYCQAEGRGQHYGVDQAGVWADAVRERRPIIHNDYLSLPHKKGMPEGHAHLVRELVVPVLRDDRVVAMLGVGNKPFPYGHRDLETVLRLADLAWDVAERKRTDQSLQASQTRYRNQFENMTQGAFLQNAEGAFTDVNPAALAMLGLTRAAFLERTAASPEWDILQEDGSPLNREQYPSALARRTGRKVTGMVVGILNPTTGDRVWVEANAIPEGTEGVTHPGSVLVTLHDLTEQRQAQEALRASSELQHAVLDSLAAHVCVLDVEGNILAVNEPWRRFAHENGITRTEGTVEHVNYFDILGKPDQHSAAELAHIKLGLAAVLQGARPSYQAEYPCDSPTEQRWFRMQALPLCSGLKGAIVTHENITDQKRAELALKESEAKLRAIVEHSRDAIGVSLNGIHVMVNPAYLEMFGFNSTESLVGTPILDLIAPEHRDLVQQRLRDRMDGKPLPSGYELIALRKDGSTFDMDVQVSTYALGGAVYTLVILRDISEQKQSQAALIESETRFRTMFEEAPIGIWEEDFTAVKAEFEQLRQAGVTDFKAHFTEHPLEVLRFAGLVRVISINRASVKILKAESETQLIRNLPKYFLPESLEAFKLALLALAEGKAFFRIESPHLDAHGQVLDFDISFVVMGGPEASASRVLVSFVDITERKQAELALLQSERQFRSLFECMDEGFALRELISDANGQPVDYRSLEVNPAYVAMTGHSREFWLGKTAREARPDQEPRWIREYGQVVRTGQPITLEGYFEDVDRWYRTTAYRPAPGQFAVLITDITQQKQAELERQQLEQQIARAQKMESLGSLAGGVAHDMNNVLGAIMGLASIHQEQAPEDSRLRKSMDTILKACTRGRTLVKGLLGFARQGLDEIRVLALNELVLEGVALLERTIPSNIRICLDLEPNLRPMPGDPASLSHILMNLCINAVDAMPEGGRLTLRTWNQGTDLVGLEVADSGCGMAPAVLEKALDPFFTTKGHGKGTGLGLAIVYGTVKAHHGRLDLTSAPGEGTRVQLQFPATTTAAPTGVRSVTTRANTRTLRILVVDDDELIQDSLSELLRSLGHLPTLANCGEEALHLLAQGLGVDAVLLDLNMPGLGGSGTLPLLRAAYPTLPVLLATGRADQTARDLVASTTHTFLLPKPFSGEEIASQFVRMGLY